MPTTPDPELGTVGRMYEQLLKQKEELLDC